MREHGFRTLLCILAKSDIHWQERLKVYGKKVRKLESAEYLAVNKPALELNVGAANRFISHAIPDLSREQKVALKEVWCIPTFSFGHPSFTQPF